MNTRLRIRSWLLGVATALAVAPMVASAATDNGTVTIGGANWGSCGMPPGQIAEGYFSGVTGSYSPTVLTGGRTVYGVYDVLVFFCSGVNTSILIVSGFSSDPGKGWLTSITCNGVTNPSSFASYSYSGGMGSWHWTTLFGFSGKTSASCSITHS